MRFGLMVMVILASGGCRDRTEQHLATTAPSTSVQISAENIERSLAAAQEYLTAREPAKAQAILLTLIKRAPAEVRGYELLGQVYAMQAEAASNAGDTATAKSLKQEAYRQYTIATGIAPDQPGLQHSAGVLAMAAELPDAALRHFQNAGRLDQTNPQYPLFEAQLLIQRQQFDDATTALNRALAVDPDEPIAHASLAMIAVEQNRFDDALKHIAEARTIAPEDVGHRAQHAKVLRRSGHPNKAVEMLIGLPGADRAREMVAVELAASFEAMNQPLKAAEAWEHCVRANSNSPKSWRWQIRAAELLLKGGQREAADQWLQRVKLVMPHAPEVESLEKAITASR